MPLKCFHNTFDFRCQVWTKEDADEFGANHEGFCTVDEDPYPETYCLHYKPVEEEEEDGMY